MEAERADEHEFTVRGRWKETVVYAEGDDEYLFEAVWGVTPHRVFVCAAEDWDAVMPAWMHGGRDVIVERLVRHSGHDVVVDPPRASSGGGTSRGGRSVRACDGADSGAVAFAGDPRWGRKGQLTNGQPTAKPERT